MGFVPAVEYEERNIHKLLSYAILMLWLMTFVMSGIAFYMYMGAQEYVEKFYIRSLLLEQAKIFLVQAISGILWFIVTLYIFISTITVEKKEKYNILSGVMFLASGVVELIVAIYLLQVRSELIYIAQRLPILTLAELRTRLARIMKLTILLALVSSIAISISIGMAFIFIGLSIKKTVMSLEMEVRRLIDTLKIEHQYIYFAYATPTNMVAYGVRRMMDGLKKMRSGGTIYIVSGVMDILSILMPFLWTISFILFIIGMFLVNSGRKMFEEGRRLVMGVRVPEQEGFKVSEHGEA